MIIAPRRHELGVVAALDDLSVLDRQDHVRAANGGKSVCDNKAGSALADALGCTLNQLLGVAVHRRGGLVQHQDRGIRQHNARKGQQLLFAR